MRNQWKTAALLALLSALLIRISYWVIGGTSGILVGIVIAAVTNLNDEESTINNFLAFI